MKQNRYTLRGRIMRWLRKHSRQRDVLPPPNPACFRYGNPERWWK